MQTHLIEVSKLLTKAPKCPATTGNNSATTQTSPDLWMFFEPLLLGPFLTCCHLSQCQLPESKSSAGLCLPAKQEPAWGVTRSPHHQLPASFLPFSSEKLPGSCALPTDTADIFVSALHHVQGLGQPQGQSCSRLTSDFSCYVPKQYHAGSAFCTCSPLLHTQRVPKTYTSGYNKAKKGTGSEPNFVYSEDKAENFNCSAL